jgi:hypothetical protein
MVLDASLSAAGISLPADLRQKVRLHRVAIAESALRNKSLLLRTLDALAAVGVVPVLLKGYAFALRYYPEPLLRPSVDVDILIPRETLRTVESALQGLGLRRYDDPDEQMEVYHHHIAFSGPPGHVEVHFRATSGLGLKEQDDAGMVLESRDAVVEGRHARLLRAEDELVYMAIHVAQHLFLRLNWIYDLKLFLEKEQIDWTRVRAIVHNSRMVPALFAALYVLEVSFGTTMPPRSQVPVPPLWQRLLIQRLFTPDRLVTGELAAHKVQRWLVHAALAEGPVRIGRDALDAVKLKLRRLARRGIAAQ